MLENYHNLLEPFAKYTAMTSAEAYTTISFARVCSTAGQVTAGKRNRLSDKQLEREVLSKKNKSFLRHGS